MSHRQPFPRLWQSLSGTVIVAAFVVAGVLYALVPAARPGLHAGAPILLAMLPTALVGAVCRVALDLLEGGRVRGASELWPLPLSALTLLAAALWMVANGWRLVETAQLTGGLCEGVLALLIPLLALGAVVLAARTGYLDGAEDTLTLRGVREEQVWSPVPVRVPHRRAR